MAQELRVYSAPASTPAAVWPVSLRQGSTAREYVTFPVAEMSSQEMVMDAFNHFVGAVRDIPSVEQVRAQVAGTYLHLVTYMSQSSKEERFAVYEAEMAAYDCFPNIRFEFDLIDRQGYPVQPGEVTGKLIEVIRDLPDLTDGNAIHEV